MPAISRDGDDLSTGHVCDPITQLDTPNQSTVFANGLLIARKTDSTVVHRFPPFPACPNHTAVVNVGSATVFAVGLEVARVGDSTDSGEMIEGSPTVFAGP